MKGQPRLHSLLEACLNILIGYFVALGAQLLIFPLYGIHISLTTNLWIGFWFTVVSLLRSYTLRRLFNFYHTRGSFMSPPSQVEFPCTFITETDAAVLVRIEDTEHWIPLSQVTRMRKPPGGIGSITFATFIAARKGLI